MFRCWLTNINCRSTNFRLDIKYKKKVDEIFQLIIFILFQVNHQFDLHDSVLLRMKKTTSVRSFNKNSALRESFRWNILFFFLCWCVDRASKHSSNGLGLDEFIKGSLSIFLKNKQCRIIFLLFYDKQRANIRFVLSLLCILLECLVTV